MRKSQRDEEFSEFVLQRSGRLLLIAQTICGDRHLAEDLVQQCLEKAYLNWARIQTDADPFWYVRRILVNENISRARRRGSREVTLDTSGHEAAALEPAVIDEEHLAQVQMINRLLDGLTPRERAVVVLRHLEDLSEQETATQLGIPLGTVKSTCSRALAKLRAECESHRMGALG